MTLTRNYVKGIGELLTSVGDLVTNVQELKGRLTSVRDDAYRRIITARKEDVGKTEGTGVSMLVDYFKGEKPVLLKQERFPIGLARKLVGANSKGKYYSTNSGKVYETARKTAEQENKQGIEPKQRTAIICPSRTDFSMSPSKNKQHYEFVFEDMDYEDDGRVSYFQLNKGPITFVPIDASIVDGNQPDMLTALNGTVQNYVWFRSLDHRSVLDGNDRYADDCNGRARGVLRKTSEAGSRKILGKQIVLPYTNSDIQEHLTTIQGIRAGNVKVKDISSKLDGLVGFLLKLKQ